MIESVDGSPFFVMALGIAIGLFVLGIWGVLAWAVVHLLSRRARGRASSSDVHSRVPTT
jgi:hypothetical protein